MSQNMSQNISQKRKEHLANTEAKGSGEPRRDDLLWKDLLARFFVPMLRSVLPDLARDIDDKRDVVFLDKDYADWPASLGGRREGNQTRTAVSYVFQSSSFAQTLFCYSDSSKPKPRDFAST